MILEKRGGKDSNNLDKKTFDKKSKQAKDRYRKQELDNRIKKYRKNNPDATKTEAEKAVKDLMKNQAALHNPDGIAGGRADDITNMGNSAINSSLGSQWKNGRADSIENQVKTQYGIPPKTIDDVPDDAMMNINLF